MKFGVQLYGPLNNMQGEVLEKLSALQRPVLQKLNLYDDGAKSVRPGRP